jgi:hypothetical protein
MGRVIFDAAAVRPLLQHTLGQTEHRPTFAELCDPAYLKAGCRLGSDGFAKASDIDPAKVPAALWCVKDQGIYLMSNGAEALRGTDGSNVVVYARGADPRTDTDWYEFARGIAGGDDFAEALNAADLRLLLEDATITGVEVRFTETEIAVSFVRDRRARR